MTQPNDLSIMGGHGYIGSAFHKLKGGIRNDRNDYEVKTANILYLISTVSNHAFLEDPQIDIQTNLSVLMDVLESYRKKVTQCGIIRVGDPSKFCFTFVSSYFVYGDNPYNSTEDTPHAPKGVYSSTKCCAENIVKSYCVAHNLNYKILRMCNVIGGVDPGAGPTKNALHYMVGQAIRGEKVTFVQNEDGMSPIREYMHVKDVCAAMDLVMKEGNMNEAYNISAEEQLSQISLVNYASNKVHGTKVDHEFVEASPLDKSMWITNSGMDGSKLRSLGFYKKYSAFSVIDELIKHETTT